MKSTVRTMIALSLVLGGSGMSVASERSMAAERPLSVESGTCSSVPQDVTQKGFLAAYARDIEHVKPLKRVKRVGKIEVVQTAGVQVYLRPQAGLTAPFVQRMAECQLARGGGAETAGDPFAIRGITSTVKETNRHIVVQLEAQSSGDGQRALEMVRRAVSGS